MCEVYHIVNMVREMQLMQKPPAKHTKHKHDSTMPHEPELVLLTSASNLCEA